MGDFFAELLKTFSEPGRKQLSAIMVVLACLVLGVGFLLFYERYTASFRLSRFQKEADLVTRLNEMNKAGETNNSVLLESARNALVDHATQTIRESPMSLEYVPSKLTFSMDNAWKFVASGFMWWVYALSRVVKLKSKEGKKQIVESLGTGCVVGIIGLFVPPVWWPWFHVFFFPLLLFAALIVIFIPILIVASNFKLAQKRAQTNACINNLRQIDGAIQQWALEKKKSDGAIPEEQEVAAYLKDDVLPQCPSGGRYKINAAKEGPTCSVPGHALSH